MCIGGFPEAPHIIKPEEDATFGVARIDRGQDAKAPSARPLDRGTALGEFTGARGVAFAVESFDFPDGVEKQTRPLLRATERQFDEKGGKRTSRYSLYK